MGGDACRGPRHGNARFDWSVAPQGLRAGGVTVRDEYEEARRADLESWLDKRDREMDAEHEVAVSVETQELWKRRFALLSELAFIPFDRGEA